MSRPATPPISFSTLACPNWSWSEVLDRGREYGYDGIEVRQIAGETNLLAVPELQPSRRAARRAELQERGLVVCGLASSVRFDQPDKSQRDEQLDAGRAYVELAADLHARFVRVFGDVFPAGVDRAVTRGRIAEGLNRLGEFAAAWHVEVLLETHGDFAQNAEVVELFRQVESPAVGVLWDTHHPWRFFNEPLDQTHARLQPWLRHTHWKDSVARPREAPRPGSAEIEAAANEAHALMSGHRHADYVLFGGGEFPAEQCAGLLKRGGYPGWLSLEWEKMWHPQIEVPEIALPLFASKIRALWACA